MEGFIFGVLVFGAYLLIFAGLMFLLRLFVKIPDELFRKILHSILLGGYIPLLFAFEVWWHPVVVIVGLAIAASPILLLLGKIPGFTAFVNERKKGEFLISLLLAVCIIIISISLGWGILNEKYIVLASVYSWGVGDAFAALIGKKYGVHKITWKFVDNKKSYEGSLAMIITSFISVLIVLLIRGGLSPLSCILVALVSSMVSTFVELCSKNGIDTITCPLASMAVMFPLIMILTNL
jgi:dolichol kinase